MTAVRDRDDVAVSGSEGLAPDLEGLRHELQQLGLRPYGARVLLALLRVGSANSAQLAVLSGVPRTSIYQAMEALIAEGLAAPLPTTGPSVWTSPGWEAIVDTLDAAEEERVRQHHARTQRLRRTVAEMAPDQSSLSA